MTLNLSTIQTIIRQSLQDDRGTDDELRRCRALFRALKTLCILYTNHPEPSPDQVMELLSEGADLVSAVSMLMDPDIATVVRVLPAIVAQAEKELGN